MAFSKAFFQGHLVSELQENFTVLQKSGDAFRLLNTSLSALQEHVDMKLWCDLFNAK